MGTYRSDRSLLLLRRQNAHASPVAVACLCIPDEDTAIPAPDRPVHGGAEAWPVVGPGPMVVPGGVVASPISRWIKIEKGWVCKIESVRLFQFNLLHKLVPVLWGGKKH